MKLIDKDAVVAEIERLNQKAIELYGYSQFNTAYNNVLKSINNLEVKEVDLEKEIENWIEINQDTAGFYNNVEFAKHFFRLGMQVSNEAQKGE